MTDYSMAADTVHAELIIVKQLPEIEERLRSVKCKIEPLIAEASAMICTEDTVIAYKSKRTEIRKILSEIKGSLSEAEEYILAPFQPIKDDCKKNLISPLESVDEQMKKAISEVEDGIIKARCEDGLRDYFAELCAVHHLDWLTYEQAGVKVDMASAKAKTPKKLREQLVTFVVGVAESVDRINLLDDSAEIMAEYKKQDRLDAAKAICDVRERHQREEEERTAQEARRAEQEREAEMVRRVEALAPPVAMEAPEPVVKCTFTVRATKAQLRKLKEFLSMEGIQYE